ncbi:hypothetical protein ACRC7T_13860 [Segnochrobactraceae bacterium EtOH-i3]
MPDIIIWPETLAPETMTADVTAFTRSGGASLGGVTRVTRTDAGWWTIAFDKVALFEPADVRVWDAVASDLGGMAGLVSVPVWSRHTAPWLSGAPEDAFLTTHSDGTPHSDDTPYAQGAISVVAHAAATIGATVLRLRIVRGAGDLSGCRFSHLTGAAPALYRTGRAIDITGDVWTLRISPPLRAPIAAGDSLEFDMPRCLCRLASDDAMARKETNVLPVTPSVSFAEATDYWSDLAAGLL